MQLDRQRRYARNVVMHARTVVKYAVPEPWAARRAVMRADRDVHRLRRAKHRPRPDLMYGDRVVKYGRRAVE